MKHTYNYFLFSDGSYKSGIKLVNLQEKFSSTLKSEKIFKVLDKSLVSPKQSLVDDILKKTGIK